MLNAEEKETGPGRKGYFRQGDPGNFSRMTFGLKDEKWAISGSGGRASSVEGSASVKVLKQE